MASWRVKCPLRRRLLRPWGAAAAALVVVLCLSATPPPHHCNLSCGLDSWIDLPHPQSKLFIDHIIAEVIEPQRDAVPDPLTAEEVGNTFLHDSSAFTVNKFLLGYIDDIVNGTFVEVGAGDGEFLSFSSQLEVLLHWKGLLVEPREDAYTSLRRRRRAAAANVCVTGGDYHSKEMLWVPAVDEGLSPLLQRSARSKAALSSFVDTHDLEDGEQQAVQCYTLGSLVTAYLRSLNASDSFIDLLILDTNAGELLMMENLSVARYRYVLIPIRDKFEFEFAMINARSLGLNVTNSEVLQSGYALFKATNIAKVVVAVTAFP